MAINLNWKKHWKWIAIGIGLFVAIILIIVAVLLSSSSGGSPEDDDETKRALASVIDPDYHKTALNYHNIRRKQHQAGPLELVEELNSNAKKCAEYYVAKHTIDHSCTHKGSAGENLYSTSTGKMELSAMAEQASRLWYEEIKDYNFDNPGFHMKTGHFTAMIWKEVTKLGVGASKSDSYSVVVALYTKHPNVENQYRENVLPKSGAQTRSQNWGFYGHMSMLLGIVLGVYHS